MTVNYEIPTIKYEGNGINTSFTFKWSCGDPNENYVKKDGDLLKEGVEYELEDFTLEHGGTMVFYEAPAVGEIIEIYRRTPITQQIDYVEGEAFPANTHEFQMDKDTRILQEMIGAGLALGGRVDLAAVHYPDYVEITNTGGNNAILKPWNIDGTEAGVKTGETVEFNETPPAAGDITDKNDGYIWWVLGTPVAAGGDPVILLAVADINVTTTLQAPGAPRAEFGINGLTGDIEYGYDPLQPTVDPGWETQPGINVNDIGAQIYYVKFEVISGSVDPLDNPSVDTWFLFSDVQNLEYLGWYVSEPGASQSVEAIFHIAPEDQGVPGTPDAGRTISRRVYLTAEQT